MVWWFPSASMERAVWWLRRAIAAIFPPRSTCCFFRWPRTTPLPHSRTHWRSRTFVRSGASWKRRWPSGRRSCAGRPPSCRRFSMPRRSALPCSAGTRPSSAATRLSSAFSDGKQMRSQVMAFPCSEAVETDRVISPEACVAAPVSRPASSGRTERNSTLPSSALLYGTKREVPPGSSGPSKTSANGSGSRTSESVCCRPSARPSPRP